MRHMIEVRQEASQAWDHVFIRIMQRAVDMFDQVLQELGRTLARRPRVCADPLSFTTPTEHTLEETIHEHHRPMRRRPTRRARTAAERR